MDNFIQRILGDYLILAQQIARTTLVFIFMIICIFVVRNLLALLFPEHDDDVISKFLHLVDAYATLLGIVGYAIWVSLDMILLLRQIRYHLGEEKNNGK